MPSTPLNRYAIPDVGNCSKIASLFDRFAGAGEQHRRHVAADRLRSLQVDQEFVLVGT
jgi:hypothetical protein